MLQLQHTRLYCKTCRLLRSYFHSLWPTRKSHWHLEASVCQSSLIQPPSFLPWYQHHRMILFHASKYFHTAGNPNSLLWLTITPKMVLFGTCTVYNSDGELKLPKGNCSLVELMKEGVMFFNLIWAATYSLKKKSQLWYLRMEWLFSAPLCFHEWSVPWDNRTGWENLPNGCGIFLGRRPRTKNRQECAAPLRL